MNVSEPILEQVFRSTEICTELCEQIIALLSFERDCLVCFKLEELLQNNLDKEQRLAELLAERKAIESLLIAVTGSSSYDNLSRYLSGGDLEKWVVIRATWEKTWSETQLLSTRNQNLINHSLKNLGQMADHLKKVIYEQSTYSAKGVGVSNDQSGKVVEGRV